MRLNYHRNQVEGQLKHIEPCLPTNPLVDLCSTEASSLLVYLYVQTLLRTDIHPDPHGFRTVSPDPISIPCFVPTCVISIADIPQAPRHQEEHPYLRDWTFAIRRTPRHHRRADRCPGHSNAMAVRTSSFSCPPVIQHLIIFVMCGS